MDLLEIGRTQLKGGFEMAERNPLSREGLD